MELQGSNCLIAHAFKLGVTFTIARTGNFTLCMLGPLSRITIEYIGNLVLLLIVYFFAIISDLYALRS